KQRGKRIESFHDVAGEVARMRGGKAYPVDAWRLSYGRQQLGKRFSAAGVEVGIYILTEQLDLGIAGFGHSVGLGEHRIGAAAAFLSARVRKDAVGAEFVESLVAGDVSKISVA